MQNIGFHFPPPKIEYEDCLTSNSHSFESTSKTPEEDHNSSSFDLLIKGCTSFNNIDQPCHESKIVLQTSDFI